MRIYFETPVRERKKDASHHGEKRASSKGTVGIRGAKSPGEQATRAGYVCTTEHPRDLHLAREETECVSGLARGKQQAVAGLARGVQQAVRVPCIPAQSFITAQPNSPTSSLSPGAPEARLARQRRAWRVGGSPWSALRTKAQRH